MNNKNWPNILLSFFLILLAFGIVAFINWAVSPKELVDRDRDGFFTIAYQDKKADCKDDDPSRNPDATDIPGDGIDQNCDGSDQLPEVDPNQVKDDIFKDHDEFLALVKNDSYVKLYENFETPLDIKTNPSDTIIKNSRRIETSGQFEQAYLYVKASVQADSFRTLGQGESIYFYIDTGDTSGHLIKSRSLKLHPEDLDNGVSYYLYRTSNLDLTSIPYNENNTPVISRLSILDVLNSENGGYNRRHYLGSFVSSNAQGILLELGIAYKCKDAPTSCLIKNIMELQ